MSLYDYYSTFIEISADADNKLSWKSDGLYATGSEGSSNLTYYIDFNAGDDTTGDGTISNPFKTIQGAYDYVRPLSTGGLQADTTFMLVGSSSYTTDYDLPDIDLNNQSLIIKSNPTDLVNLNLVEDTYNIDHGYLEFYNLDVIYKGNLSVAGSFINLDNNSEFNSINSTYTVDTSSVISVPLNSSYFSFDNGSFITLESVIIDCGDKTSVDNYVNAAIKVKNSSQLNFNNLTVKNTKNTVINETGLVFSPDAIILVNTTDEKPTNQVNCSGYYSAVDYLNRVSTWTIGGDVESVAPDQTFDGHNDVGFTTVIGDGKVLKKHLATEVNDFFEQVSRKKTSWATTTSDTDYPSEKLVKDSLDLKLDKNTPITADTHTKITYDSNGLVLSGTDLIASDIPDLKSVYKILNPSVSTTQGDFKLSVDSSGNLTWTPMGSFGGLYLGSVDIYNDLPTSLALAKVLFDKTDINVNDYAIVANDTYTEPNPLYLGTFTGNYMELPYSDVDGSFSIPTIENTNFLIDEYSLVDLDTLDTLEKTFVNNITLLSGATFTGQIDFLDDSGFSNAPFIQNMGPMTVWSDDRSGTTQLIDMSGNVNPAGVTQMNSYLAEFHPWINSITSPVTTTYITADGFKWIDTGTAPNIDDQTLPYPQEIIDPTKTLPAYYNIKTITGDVIEWELMYKINLDISNKVDKYQRNKLDITNSTIIQPLSVSGINIKTQLVDYVPLGDNYTITFRTNIVIDQPLNIDIYDYSGTLIVSNYNIGDNPAYFSVIENITGISPVTGNIIFTIYNHDDLTDNVNINFNYILTKDYEYTIERLLDRIELLESKFPALNNLLPYNPDGYNNESSYYLPVLRGNEGQILIQTDRGIPEWHDNTVGININTINITNGTNGLIISNNSYYIYQENLDGSYTVVVNILLSFSKGNVNLYGSIAEIQPAIIDDVSVDLSPNSNIMTYSTIYNASMNNQWRTTISGPVNPDGFSPGILYDVYETGIDNIADGSNFILQTSYVKGIAGKTNTQFDNISISWLDSTTLNITGVLLDEDNNPLANEIVNITLMNNVPLQVTTAIDGSFTLSPTVTDVYRQQTFTIIFSPTNTYSGTDYNGIIPGYPVTLTLTSSGWNGTNAYRMTGSYSTFAGYSLSGTEIALTFNINGGSPISDVFTLDTSGAFDYISETSKGAQDIVGLSKIVLIKDGYKTQCNTFTVQARSTNYPVNNPPIGGC